MIIAAVFTITACGTPANEKQEENQTEKQKETENPPVNFNASISAMSLAAKMECGWNLGNTLDARSETSKYPHNQGVSSQTCWSEELTTEKIIKTGYENGYKTIRIPVTWCNHLVDTNYTIDSAWMDRVKEIVDWSIAAGYYVILNEHHSVHDNMTAPLKHCEGYIARADSADESKAFLEAIWEQICETFNNDYDEHLIFETMNEPRNTSDSHCWDPQIETCAECKADVQLVNEYNQLILDTIRASGGNNSQRFVMIPGNGTGINCALADYFELPNDSAKDKLIVTVHKYPLDWGGTGKGSRHFDADVKAELTNDAKNLYQKFVSKGIPVVVGECGSCKQAIDVYENGGWHRVSDFITTYEDRLECFKYFASVMGKYSIPLINWDVGGEAGHATIDRKNCKLFEPDYVAAVIKAWKDANANPDSVSVAADDLEIDLNSLKGWDGTTLDKKTNTFTFKEYTGGDVWLDAKDGELYSKLVVNYKDASDAFKVTIGYTDSNAKETKELSKGSGKVEFDIDSSKSVQTVQFMAMGAPCSVTIAKIVFLARK